MNIEFIIPEPIASSTGTVFPAGTFLSIPIAYYATDRETYQQWYFYPAGCITKMSIFKNIETGKKFLCQEIDHPRLDAQVEVELDKIWFNDSFPTEAYR